MSAEIERIIKLETQMQSNVTMLVTPEQIDTAVEKAVNKYVNGKLDNLKTSMDGLKKDFKDHVDIVQPIIQQFNDRRGFWNTLSTSGKNIAIISGGIVGLGIIAGLIKKLFL